MHRRTASESELFSVTKNPAGVTSGRFGIAFAVLVGGSACVAGLAQGRLLVALGFFAGTFVLVLLNVAMMRFSR